METRQSLRFICLAALFILLSCGYAWVAAAAAGPAKSPVAANDVPVQNPSMSGVSQGPTAQAPSPAKNSTPPPCSGPSCPLTPTAGPSGDIRDIRGPIHMPNPLSWIWGVIGAMMLLFLALAFWKWFRKRGAMRAKRAFEMAFEALEKAKALMTPEQAEAYSVAVSGIIRTYIEKRFSVKATRHTTHEFMMAVASESSGDLSHHHDRLQAFMANCDLAKFARHKLPLEQMEKMHESAWQFVMETKPREEEKSITKTPEPVNHAAPEMDAALGTSSAPKSSSWRKRNKKFSGLKKDEDPSLGLSHAHQPAAAGGR